MGSMARLLRGFTVWWTFACWLGASRAFKRRRRTHGHTAGSAPRWSAILLVVMSAYEELREEVRLYLAGQQPLMRLREWVEAHVEDVSASDDERLRELDSDVWDALSEGDTGVLTGEGVRRRLAAALAARLDDPLEGLLAGAGMSHSDEGAFRRDLAERSG